MRINEYGRIVDGWKQQYGVSDRRGAFRYDPSEVRASCAKCGKIKSKMGRHHKCNDFFFALWMPDIYAKRYVEFRKEDCVKLCNDCHRNIERYSKRLKEALYRDFNIVGIENLTEEWAEKWRAQFGELFNRWISKPIRKRHRRRRR